MDKMQQVLVRMPPALYEELKNHAESKDRSIAADVRRAVRLYLADQQKSA